MPVTTLDQRTALVLIDLQLGATWLLGAEAMDPVVAAAARVAASFRERRLPVVLVKVDFQADGSDRPHNRVSVERVAGTPPADWARIITTLGPVATDVVITKRTTGAFHGTDLDLLLRRRGVTGMVIGGVTTSMGVEATARDAYDRGYNVTFAVDAMTDADPAAHRHCVEKVFPVLGEVDTVTAITGHLDRPADFASSAMP
jgi:nicotinamidase-related amidase